MQSLDELILYGRESDHLEFKVKQYNKDKWIDLIKDIMAMANGSYEGDKYIIIGVRQESPSRFDPIGITEELIDDSNYQQTIREYIEPAINFEYFAHEIETKKFGIFRISGNNNRPYMIKKSYGKLPEGFANIRKGTFQPIILRSDLDLIQERKQSISHFGGKVKLFPFPANASGCELQAARMMSLPSQQEAHLIEYHIYRKNNPAPQPLLYTQRLNVGIDHYSHMDLSQLEDALRRVKTSWLGEDNYSKYEEHAAKLNFLVANTSIQFLKRGFVRLQLPAVNGIEIADRINYKPSIGVVSIGRTEKPQKPLYPTVTRDTGLYLIDQEMCDIKHHQDNVLFVNPLRIWVSPSLIGTKFEIQATIFGENLPTPIQQTIDVRCV